MVCQKSSPPQSSRDSRAPFQVQWVLLGLLIGLTCALTRCGGGGGGGSASDVARESVLLREVSFQDPAGQLISRDLQGPDGASLIQQIELRFNGRVNIDEVTANGITLRDALTGDDVSGEFAISSDRTRVTFLPDFPTIDTTLAPLGWEGNSAFLPDREYRLSIPIGVPGALSNLTGLHFSVQKQYGFIGADFNVAPFTIDFKTTAEPDKFWTGVESKAPSIVSVYPSDLAEDIPLHRFRDLDSWKPFIVEFDAPLNPSAQNIGDLVFHIRDLTDSSGNPVERDLAIDVRLQENQRDHSIVRVDPVGLLPAGHELAFVIDEKVQGIAGGESSERAFHQFRTRSDEGPSSDRFTETFATNNSEESDTREIEDGSFPADWNRNGSGQLRAIFDFPGQGELGAFLPVPEDQGEKTIALNTDRQELPLPDGSTPGVRTRTIITGGVFNFTQIAIPNRVTVIGTGSNPLVLTATERIQIDGRVDVSGSTGDNELSKDQALSPLLGGRGGAGGGRGGEGHPTLFDPITGAYVSPAYGRPGEPGRGSTLQGGFPGQSGVFGERSVGCGNGKGKAAGGGGGSYAIEGEVGKDGQGDEDTTTTERTDAEGNQIFTQLPGGTTIGGLPGITLFRDENPENDFFGRRGEYEFLIGGQGGGGGGSRLDSLHCEGKYPGLPTPTADSRGGGGGGGAGILEILCLNDISLGGTAEIFAKGGTGGKGENSSNQPRAGGGGGGSGGVIRVMAAGRISGRSSNPRPTLSVAGGPGAFSAAWGSGGDGSPGLVQLQSPTDQVLRLGDFSIDPSGAIVDPELTPSEITSVSVGQSKWLNFGEGVMRDSGKGPEYLFEGIGDSGFVITNENGYLPAPESSDIRVDQLPVIDLGTGRMISPGFNDRIPENATVRVSFQGAQPISSDKNEADPSEMSPWSNSIDVANGYQMIRYKVTMDIAKSFAYPLSPDLPRVAIRKVQIRCLF